tara:strand:+ start:1495 stop:1896 length:402 start_codon:yes stop_codon:yes gene_type:complete
MKLKDKKWLQEIRFNEEGLIPAIAQDHQSGRVLMLAWMNRNSLQTTIDTKKLTYWSRSRQKIWVKGEESGNEQNLVSMQLDCDGDVLLIKVKQKGNIACHTGRNSCFYRELGENGWETAEPVIKNPEEIYTNG